MQFPLKSVTAERYVDNTLDIGIAFMQGARPDMEDGHLAYRCSNGAWCMAIFDGHGGRDISRILPPLFRDYLERHIDQEYNEQFFKQLFMDIDERVCKYHNFEYNQQTKDVYMAGSTAVVVLLYQKRWWFAHVGDSRAYLNRKNTSSFEYISEDHIPTSNELLRVLKAGYVMGGDGDSYITHPTLRMGVAPARCFGDLGMKCTVDLPIEEQAISCIPTVRSFEWESGDTVFLCCDGVIEANTSMNLCDYLDEVIHSNESVDVIAAQTVVQCFAHGSQDNISALFIRDSTFSSPDINHMLTYYPELPQKVCFDNPVYALNYRRDIERANISLVQAVRRSFAAEVRHLLSPIQSISTISWLKQPSFFETSEHLWRKMCSFTYVSSTWDKEASPYEVDHRDQHTAEEVFLLRKRFEVKPRTFRYFVVEEEEEEEQPGEEKKSKKLPHRYFTVYK